MSLHLPKKSNKNILPKCKRQRTASDFSRCPLTNGPQSRTGDTCRCLFIRIQHFGIWAWFEFAAKLIIFSQRKTLRHASRILASSWDFVALMSDGAPINAAIAWEAGLCQQQCLAHAIHLAVSDLLYDTSLSSQVNSTEDSSDKEEDEVEDELSSPYFIQVFLEDKSLLGHWNYFTPPTQKSIRKTSCFWCVFWNAILRQLWRRNSNQSQWHHKVHPPAMRASTTGLRRKGEKEHRLAARWSRPLTVSWRPTTNLDSLDRTCSKPRRNSNTAPNYVQLRAGLQCGRILL